MFWKFLIGFAVLYLLQTLLSLRQGQDFARTFAALRRKGRVAIGKKKGLFISGAFVLLLLDENDVVVEGKVLSGVSVMNRFKPLNDFNGRPMIAVSAADSSCRNKSVLAAIDNALFNYALTLAGQQPPEPPGPFAEFAAGFKRVFGKKSQTTN